MRPDISEVRKQFRYNPETGELRRAGYMVGLREQSPGRGVQVWCVGSNIPASHICFAIQNGRWPSEGFVIDHINGNPKDNRICNLRECTQQQNTQNRKLHSNNKLGLKGVSWHKYKKMYQTTIKVNGAFYHCGYYRDPQVAGEVYAGLAKLYFGEFVRT